MDYLDVQAELEAVEKELMDCISTVPNGYEEINNLRERYDKAMLKAEGLNRLFEVQRMKEGFKAIRANNE